MNLGNLITEAQRLAGRVDSDFNTRTRRWINEGIEQWSITVPWPTLIKRETFIANGNRTLVLPQRVRAIQWVGDPTNKRHLRPSDFFEREFSTSFFSSDRSAPFFFHERGFTPVTAQPSVGSILTFNTESSDVFTVYIDGLALDTRASGTANEKFYTFEQISITDSSTYSSANRYVEIFTLGKDDFTPADLVAFNGSEILARVEANRYRSEYRQIEFVHIPTAGDRIDIEYVTNPEPLIYNYQIPHPSIDVEYLIHYAAAKIHAAMNQGALAEQMSSEAQVILNRRIYNERLNKENDLRALPDIAYFGYEDDYVWPAE